MRIISSALTALVSASCLCSNAWAWDPNEGAEDLPAPTIHYKPAPQNFAPQRSYAPVMEAPAVSAPVPVAAAAPAPTTVIAAPPDFAAAAPEVAPAPPTVLAQERSTPVENYPALEPAAGAQQTPTTLYYPQPTAAAPAYSYTPAQQPATYYGQQYADQHGVESTRTNYYMFGVNGYWDRYREPDGALETNSGFGGLNGSWTHYYDPSIFSRLELRGDYGREDYKSVSGSEDGITAWEYDARALIGYDASTGDGGHIKPYMGLDTRYYREDGKDGVTNLGFEGYDRRILQFFLPIGVTYDIPTSGGYHIVPNIEGGPLLYGNVSSRLGNVPGNTNEVNHQHSGYEVSADLMVNELNSAGRGWEFGPFVRYYHIDDSDITGTGADRGLEPNNTRLQLGGKMDFLF